MADQGTTGEQRVALISGAARRVGAGIARHLHARGLRVVLHYRGSRGEAEALAAELNAERQDSARLLQGDLLDTEALPALAARAVAAFGRLDGLVNNASSFFPTEVGRIDEAAWHDLMGSNLKAPLFLSQALAPELAKRRGAIVGIADIHVERPMARHVVYNLAKAGHAQLIRSLAIELAPSVRVNGVSPGVNLWPEDDASFDAAERAAIEASIPLRRTGVPEDIAQAVAFLLLDAGYVTGQILAVDGGRSVVL
ncbi:MULTISPECIES: pteridine reductase [Chromobacterium]|uniref:Pteridine reductase n=2 Tax=Chromobacterium TaxID=535 RepID=A0ABS3GRU0_9NEIS|nr:MULTISPECIES: pteridine reductase [Chromobacterium]AXT45122.1 pteridine reductase [Chromobacterium rhizoryzae]MBK0416567.1 pteridine reductase [Chromobacterium haemolyticum]MBO0417761.1 pteridine reductase [Chromobacterium haemolyticum]MBO0500953.1 pteridine reductase [Chromobacterium haemolyticum]MDH0343541.1 pteridine reductase [Chromobacterium haemolyticum]